MNHEQHTDLWDQLERALALQAQNLRQGKWRDLESALDQSRAIVDRIHQDDPTRPPPSVSQQERIQRSYEQLMLMAEAQKQTVDERLQRLRGSRRVLRVYHRHR